MCESSCSENSEEVASINGSSGPAGKSVPGSKHIHLGIAEYKEIEGSMDYIILSIIFWKGTKCLQHKVDICRCCGRSHDQEPTELYP